MPVIVPEKLLIHCVPLSPSHSLFRSGLIQESAMMMEIAQAAAMDQDLNVWMLVALNWRL